MINIHRWKNVELYWIFGQKIGPAGNSGHPSEVCTFEYLGIRPRWLSTPAACEKCGLRVRLLTTICCFVLLCKLRTTCKFNFQESILLLTSWEMNITLYIEWLKFDFHEYWRSISRLSLCLCMSKTINSIRTKAIIILDLLKIQAFSVRSIRSC